MAGVYIHIPFCLQKCGYCNFYSISVVETQCIASLRKIYVDALIAEIILRKNVVETQCIASLPIETVYFGGGTPSLLDIPEIVKIFETLQTHFLFSENMEITFEGNPETLTKNYLENLRNYTPINRLSVGVQSFFEEDLKYLNRKHSPKQVFEALENAQKLGFENLSIDLIYGIPTSTNEMWEENLRTFFSLDISHLSAYALTVEPNTFLDQQIRNFKTQAPKEKHIEQHYLILRKHLKNHGFEAYEVSNFCKNKQYSKHNSNYWNLSKYYGFGASAHSFSGSSRSWNIADVDTYISTINKGVLPNESEILTEKMQYNEYVMTAIRTQWGISQNFIKTNFDESFLRHFQENIAQIPNNWLIFENEKFIATEKGALFADLIAEKLFVL
ncbi:MAG: radical SAM family heme chaperone HemW [Bacteroidales bacterium]|nr:radical SAM family heme chaperone HemW [Bacteroidales bacterium]